MPICQIHLRPNWKLILKSGLLDYSAVHSLGFWSLLYAKRFEVSYCECYKQQLQLSPCVMVVSTTRLHPPLHRWLLAVLRGNETQPCSFWPYFASLHTRGPMLDDVLHFIPLKGVGWWPCWILCSEGPPEEQPSVLLEGFNKPWPAVCLPERVAKLQPEPLGVFYH